MAPSDPERAVWYAGPLLVGGFLSYFLYGAFWVQTVYYFQTTPLSRRFAYGIILVVAVSLIELAHVVAMTSAVFNTLAVNIPKGDLSFRTPPISLAIAPLHTMLHVLLQFYFAIRIRKFAPKNLWFWSAIPWLIVLLGLAQLGASFAIAYFTAQARRQLGTLTRDAGQYRARMTWFALDITNDVLITASLIYLYVAFRVHTQYKDSRSWLNQLIRHTVENGVLMSIFSILHIVFFVAMKDNLIYLGLAYFNSRLYSNVLLASLNANRRIQREAEGEVGSTITMSEFKVNTPATTATATGESSIQFTTVTSRPIHSRLTFPDDSSKTEEVDGKYTPQDSNSS